MQSNQCNPRIPEAATLTPLTHCSLNDPFLASPLWNCISPRLELEVIKSYSTMETWTTEHRGGHRTGWLQQISWNSWHAWSQNIKYSYCKNKISCSWLCFADSNFPKGWRRWLPADFKQEGTKGSCKHINASCIPGKLQDQTLTSWNKALHSLYLFWKQTHTSMLKQVKIFH